MSFLNSFSKLLKRQNNIFIGSLTKINTNQIKGGGGIEHKLEISFEKPKLGLKIQIYLQQYLGKIFHNTCWMGLSQVILIHNVPVLCTAKCVWRIVLHILQSTQVQLKTVMGGAHQYLKDQIKKVILVWIQVISPNEISILFSFSPCFFKVGKLC